MTAADRLLIGGGDVVDGTGAASRRADVLVEDGRIAAVGLDSAVDAPVLDAAGAVVAPGFMDVHTHADFTLLAFPSADSAVRQGVTTVVTGNCGGGVAPSLPGRDVRRVAFAYSAAWGVDITWRDFDEYMELLGAAAVNVAALVPHGAVRNAVMGLEPRPCRARELDRMRVLVSDALDHGAAGLSTGLEYQPGCHADLAEICALAEHVAARGGVYATHIRNRAERFADATREAIEVARRTGVRLQISHFAPRPYAPRAEVQMAFEAVEEARSEGLEVWVDTFPEMWGPGTLADLLPPDVTQDAPATVLRRLALPETRRAVADYLDSGENFLLRAGGLDRVFISSSPVRREYHGRSLTALAAAAGRSVADFACDALLEAREEFMSVGIRHVYATEDDLRGLLRLPYCSFGSDGVVVTGEGTDCAFPWSASSYGYAARTLAHYVRDVRLLSLEEAVRRLAALPAAALGLRDRGVIEEGAAADLVVFDRGAVLDRTTPDDMARHPEGVMHVVVNGRPVVRDGAATGDRPGRLVSAR